MGLWSGVYDWSENEGVGAYLFNKFFRDNLKHLEEMCSPMRQTLWWDEALAWQGNAIQVYAPVSQAYLMRASQNPANINDITTHSVVLAAGRYRVDLLGMTGDDCGIAHVVMTTTHHPGGDYVPALADYELGTVDCYSAATAYNVHLLGTNTYFYVPDAVTRYMVLIYVPAKNAASSDYSLRLTRLSFIPDEGDW